MISFDNELPDWMKVEPLHGDLVPFVREGGAIGKMVHSPLVICPLSMGIDRCSQINGLYAQKMAHLADAQKARDYHRVIMLHERPYRFDALQALVTAGMAVDTPDYWQLIRQVWTDSENIFEAFEDWRELWRAGSRHRHHVMDEGDRAAFSAMRSRIRVYRGWGLYGTDKGLSWTTSRRQAIWFANRFDGERAYSGKHGGYVGSGWVEKENVYAFLNNRSENEMVIDPKHIEKWEHIEV